MQLTDIDGAVAVDQAVAYAEFTFWPAKAMKKSLKTGASGYVYEIEDVCQGFILYRIAADQCEILQIAVSPACQRQGVGTSLLNACWHDCQEQGANIINLDVRDSNTPARQLYLKWGFEVVGWRKGYYRTGQGREDAILMSFKMSSA